MNTLVPLGLALAWTAWAGAQSVPQLQDGELPLTPGKPGDQVQPALALGAQGGYLVWQDNALESGPGVAALRLDASGALVSAPFAVSQSPGARPERPRVAVLPGGGAAFVWQAGRTGFPEVFARFAGPDGQFAGDETRVSSLSSSTTERFTATWQVLRNNRWVSRRYRLSRVIEDRSELNASPAVAALPGGEFVVAWAAMRQSITNEPVLSPSVRFLYNRFFTNSLLSSEARAFDSLRDIALQRFSASGAKLGGLFLANQSLRFNQRDPALAALPGGGFVAAWVSEHRQTRGAAGSAGNPAELALNQLEVYARLFDASGAALSPEFLASPEGFPASGPAVAALPGGGFRLAWAQRGSQAGAGWDVFTRAFSASGAAQGPAARANTHTVGDQYAPCVAALPQGELLVWTSLSQDGSWEGVYGQWISGGAWAGGELRLNETTAGRQFQPAAAADGAGGCLAVWSAQNDAAGYDLAGRRFVPAQP